MGKIGGLFLVRAWAETSALPPLGGFPADQIDRLAVAPARLWLWATLGFMVAAIATIVINLSLARKVGSDGDVG